jgi:glyoxylase-like metal-dependent hydrolase (beta-lactamase superfamily II)
MGVQIFPLKVSINTCYVIRDRGAIMIDGGPPKKGNAIKALLSRCGIRPEDIRLIVLTHGHFDHAGSVADLKSLTGAKIAIHEEDRPDIENSRYRFPPGVTTWGRLTRAILEPILRSRVTVPPAKADIVLSNNDFSLREFGINGDIIHTPGHTAGSVSVVLDSGEAFVGCMAHNGFPFRLRPGLPIYSDDIERVKESWKPILERGARVIYPAHGKPFPVDAIKKFIH